MRRVVLALLLIPFVVAGCGSDGGSAGTDAGSAAPGARTTTATMAAGDSGSAAPAPAPAPAAGSTAPAPAGDPVAHLVRATQLRDRPGGRVVGRAAATTEWGQPRYLPVVERRDGWLGVIATERPNGAISWIPATGTEAAVAPVRLVADLSDRRVRVIRDGRTIMRFTVGIGAPATPTPTGTFAVTDGLFPDAGSSYGCCILALSGHQPNVPQGWAGGDRLAIHGTTNPSSIGQATSRGCLRAGERDLRRLLAVVGLGSTIEIRA